MTSEESKQILVPWKMKGCPLTRPCPNDSQLLAFASGELGADDLAGLEQHLDGCSACRAIVGAAALRTGVDDAASTLVGGEWSARRVGQTIDRYRVVSMLGSGAMGVVVRATDPALGRDVALKLLHPTCDDPGLERRLTKEAQALARLSHPNVVQVYDVGHTHGRVFLAMELVEGTTLRAWLHEQPRRVPEILEVFIAAANGLAAAHAEGIVHRDFKPENVLVGRDGRVRVSDFGLAYAAAELRSPPGQSTDPPSSGDSSFRSTRTGMTIGTPAYMAPEQYAGEEISAATDQFAVCVALYEALYGERPFGGRSYEELAAAVLRGALRIPRRRDVPRSVALAIARGLSVDPLRRFPSISALATVLRGRDRSRRSLAVASGLVAAVVVGAGFAIADERVPSCEGVAAEIAPAWSNAAGERVHAAFVATGEAYAQDAAGRTVRELDAYAQRWVVARQSTCDEARTGARDEASSAAALACLDSAARVLATTVRVLEAGEGSVVETASSLVSELEDPDACLVVREPLDVRLAGDPEYQRLRAVVEEALVLRRAGRLDDARALHERHHAALDALEPSPLRVRALLSRGLIASDRRETAEAIDMLTQAHWLAVAQALPKEAASTALRLAFVHNSASVDREQAYRWLREGQVAARQADDPRLTSAALGTEAALLRADGEYRQARARYGEALAILTREGEDDPLVIASDWHMLGAVSRQLGEYDRAEVEIREALAIGRDGLGPEHPFVARVHVSLADTARARGDWDSAHASLDAAIAIFRGGRTLTLPMALHQRGLLEQEHGEHARAIRTLEEAVALFEQLGAELERGHAWTVMGISRLALGQLEAAHADLSRALQLEHSRGRPARADEAWVQFGLGEVESEMGRIDDARRRYTAAIELWEASAGVDAALLGPPLTGLAELELAQGNVSVARALLERALPLCSPLLAERDELGETSFALARALWADRGATAEDRRRAIALGRAAATAFTEAGPHEAARRDEAQRWVDAKAGELAAE